MAGWEISNGKIVNYNVDSDKLWELLNYVFSDSCHKRNTYKFGLIKAIIDNLLNCTETINYNELFLSYKDIFSKFTENYWNLVLKYNLKQMIRDGKSDTSKIEIILRKHSTVDGIFNYMEYSSLNLDNKNKIESEVFKECKKYVIGALYEDFEGYVYSFDLKGSGIYISKNAYDFLLKYKAEIEKINYYSWAKFLEKINDETVLVRVIDKIELSTPKRNDLSLYRDILYNEFEECTCFYCGKKLNNVHVDHFIPWSFVKNDNIWNFVLSCPQCNIKKKDKLPVEELIVDIKKRNNMLKNINNKIVIEQFKNYNNDIISKLWKYAKLSGLKVINK